MFTLKTVKKQDGFSLVEIIVVIVVLGIAVFPLSRLLRINLVSSAKAEKITRATFTAQEKMEEIIGDYKNPGRGYAYVTDVYNYPEESVGGFTRTVDVTVGDLNGITCAEITVTVNSVETGDMKLRAWLVQ